MIVILPPQFELYVTLRTAPDTQLVLDAKVHGVFMSVHVSLLPEALLAEVAGPGLELEVHVLLVALQTEVGSEGAAAGVAVVLPLVAILVLVPDVPREIHHRLKTHRTDLLDTLMDRLDMSLQGLVGSEHGLTVLTPEHLSLLVTRLFMSL